jgi:hypothetical protein
VKPSRQHILVCAVEFPNSVRVDFRLKLVLPGNRQCGGRARSLSLYCLPCFEFCRHSWIFLFSGDFELVRGLVVEWLGFRCLLVLRCCPADPYLPDIVLSAVDACCHLQICFLGQLYISLWMRSSVNCGEAGKKLPAWQ